MIFAGIDDTDVIDSPGTNQLAKSLATHLADRFNCRLILRHQLLVDERVPYTSKNSSATLLLSPVDAEPRHLDELFEEIATIVQNSSADGSDPGLCMGRNVPSLVTSFGLRCKTALCTQQEARDLAEAGGLLLTGLGGTEDGVIGAVAAVGLAASGDDGRVVMIDGHDDLSGICQITDLHKRRVKVRCHEGGQAISQGRIDIGKHLRPNLRNHAIVQHAVKDAGRAADLWKAVRLP